MLAKERRQLIVTELNRNGKIYTSELAAQFSVSDVTIRTDLDNLERSGRLTRTHGGAVPAERAEGVVAFELRLAMQSEAKRAIALKAAEFIRGDQSIIIDAGSTTQHLAQVIPDVTDLTVYTPGITIAQQLLMVDGVSTHLLGGRVDPDWMQTVGTPREQGLKDVLVQTVFLGAYGLDDDLDAVDESPDMARQKLQYVRRARTVILLLDSSKLGRHASTKVMPIDHADYLITDTGITQTDRERITARDTQLIIAG
jgi:DeoR family transcriptional regulator of aga operon